MPTDSPLIVYVNHASWWDPLVCLTLHNHFFAPRPAYAPIAAEGLKKYPFFKRLGFFPVEQGAAGAARDFLNTSQAVLAQKGTALWITPQGAFRDVRDRPVRLRPGLAALVERVPEVLVIPAAIEYVFFQERLPEVVVSFGDPVTKSQFSETVSAQVDWSEILSEKLEQAQDKLASEVQSRDRSRFQVVLSGKSGVGAIYDLWRRGRARWTGTPISLEHETT